MDLTDYTQLALGLASSFPYTADEFLDRFREKHGFRIPIDELGFNSSDGFMDQVPDVVADELLGKRVYRFIPRECLTPPADLPPEPQQSIIQLATNSIQDAALLSKALFVGRVVGLLEKVGRESTKDALSVVYRSHFGAEFTSDAMLYFNLHCFSHFVEFFQEKISMFEFSIEDSQPVWVFRLKEVKPVPKTAYVSSTCLSILSPLPESSEFQPCQSLSVRMTESVRSDSSTNGLETTSQPTTADSDPICHRDSVKPGNHSTPKVPRTCPVLNLDDLAWKQMETYGMLEPVIDGFPEKLRKALVAAPANRATLDSLCVVFRRKYNTNFVTAMKDALGAFSQRQIRSAVRRYQMVFFWDDDWYFALKGDRSSSKAKKQLPQLETIKEQPRANEDYEQMTILSLPSSPSPPTPPRLPPPPPPAAFTTSLMKQPPVVDLDGDGAIGGASSSTVVVCRDYQPSSPKRRLSLEDRLAIEFGIGKVSTANKVKKSKKTPGNK